MIINVLNAEDIGIHGCDFASYDPVVTLEITKTNLSETNIYDLVKPSVKYEFNLYTINEAAQTLDIFRKNDNNDLNVLKMFSDNDFNALNLYFVLGRFVSANVDGVTILYAGSDEVCGLELNSIIGPQMFVQAESSVLAPAHVGVGGRKSRKHRKSKRGGRRGRRGRCARVKRRTHKPRRRGTKHYSH